MNRFLKLFLLFCGAFSALDAGAQFSVALGSSAPAKYDTLGRAALKVLYEVKSPPVRSIPSLDDSVKISSDYLVLEIGENSISRYFSDNNRRMDSLMTEMLKNSNRVNLSSDVMKENGISSSGTELQIYKNYPAGKMTVTDKISLSSYLYEENMDEIAWEILPDTTTCLNYLCQKAVCDFRGRRYEAWFAPELPINNGPWKFSGLPGLILKAETPDGRYSFTAIGLENYDKPVLFAKRDYIKASRKDYEKVKRRSIEDFMNFMRDSNPDMKIEVVVQNNNGSRRTNDEIKFVYNPIELE